MNTEKLSSSLDEERAISLIGCARRIFVGRPEPQATAPEGLLFCGLGEVVALYREVALEEWTGPAGETNLQNLEWVAPRVDEHHRALDWAFRFSPVFPVRFGSLFSSRRSLEDWLTTHCLNIADFLGQVDGLREFGIKFLLASQADVSEQAPGSAELSGAAYLRRQASRHADERESRERDAEMCERLAGRLSKHAQEGRMLRPGSAPEGFHVLRNQAFLIAEGIAPSFLGEIDSINQELARGRLRLESSGPWPPYSFCPNLL